MRARVEYMRRKGNIPAPDNVLEFYGQCARGADSRTQGVFPKQFMTRRKLIIFLVVVLGLAGVVVFSILRRNRDVVVVQVAPAGQGRLVARVTASGAIKPKNYADVSANSIGQITHLYVHEGEKVRTGQKLAELWNVQQRAAVAAQQANLKNLQAQLRAQQEALATNLATLRQSQASLRQQQANWKRYQSLYHAELVARSDYDTAEESWRSAVAQVNADRARVAQSRATVRGAQSQIHQAQATLRSSQDALGLTIYTSPLSGVVTYLPVHVGDTAVMGIQNSPGSELMEVANLSVVTAHLQVDESDIAHVHDGEAAVVDIDAFPNHPFHGVVTEVGDTALLQSTGQAATTSGGAASQEAKNFKVVVTLNHPPQGIRTGLSCTGHIITAVAPAALYVPIQSIVERDPAQLSGHPAPAAGPGTASPPAKLVQGIFVIQNGRAVFVRVRTGVASADNIQILNGVRAGQQVVTGPYTALRTLKNHARIKIQALPAASGGKTSNG